MKTFYRDYEKWLDDTEALEIQEDDDWNNYIHELYEGEKMKETQELYNKIFESIQGTVETCIEVAELYRDQPDVIKMDVAKNIRELFKLKHESLSETIIAIEKIELINKVGK